MSEKKENKQTKPETKSAAPKTQKKGSMLFGRAMILFFTLLSLCVVGCASAALYRLASDYRFQSDVAEFYAETPVGSKDAELFDENDFAFVRKEGRDMAFYNREMAGKIEFQRFLSKKLYFSARDLTVFFNFDKNGVLVNKDMILY